MACEHLQSVHDVQPHTDAGCEECLRDGGFWVHLRLCMECGYVGCCDNSPSKHARIHATSSLHPVVQSFEPGENWVYCFIDDQVVAEIPDLPPRARL